MDIEEPAGAEERASSTRLELAAMTCRLLTESWVYIATSASRAINLLHHSLGLI
jgi:hypothetical protein